VTVNALARAVIRTAMDGALPGGADKIMRKKFRVKRAAHWMNCGNGGVIVSPRTVLPRAFRLTSPAGGQHIKTK